MEEEESFWCDCRNYDLSSEKCLQIYKKFAHNQLKYENGAKPENRYVYIIELIKDKVIKNIHGRKHNLIQLHRGIENTTSQNPKRTKKKQKAIRLHHPTPPDNNIKRQ